MKKSLKVVSILLVLVMMMSLFMACSQSEEGVKKVEPEPQTNKTEEQKPAEKVKMRVCTYHVGQDAWTGVYNESLKDYMAKNPNVELIDESVPAPGDVIRTKIKTDFASGNEPDVMFFFSAESDAKPLVESGKLFNFDEELKKDSAWGSKFSEGALEAVRYKDGKIYSLPTLGFYEAMICNKDLFDANGLALPKTYADLKKAVEVFKAKDITPLASSMKDSYYLIETFILSAGGVNGHKTAYDPSWAKGLNYIKELYALGAFPTDSLTMGEKEANTLFIDKKAAMLINGSWALGELKDKDNAVVIPLPLVPDAKADPSDIIGGFGSGWYMSKELNEKKNGEPLKLVKYFTSLDTVTKFVAVAAVPGLKGIAPSTATPVQKSGYEMMGNAKNTSVPIQDWIGAEPFNMIKDNMAYIVTGEKSVEEILKQSKDIYDKK